MKTILYLCGLTTVLTVAACIATGVTPANILLPLLGVALLLVAGKARPAFSLPLYAAASAVYFSQLLCVIMYALATFNYPLADDWLGAIDRFVGIDAAAIAQTVNASPLLHGIFNVAYQSMLPQIIFVICWLGFKGERQRLETFLRGMIVCALLTFGCFVFFPALGNCGTHAPVHYQQTISDLLAMRSGAMSISGEQGLVTFPSYHAICALLLIAAVPRWPMIVLNVAMLVSTLPIGMHYFADLLGAGVVFTLVNIQPHLWKLYFRKIFGRSVCFVPVAN